MLAETDTHMLGIIHQESIRFSGAPSPFIKNFVIGTGQKKRLASRIRTPYLINLG
jgi:hypothetical protein